MSDQRQLQQQHRQQQGQQQQQQHRQQQQERGRKDWSSFRLDCDDCLTLEQILKSTSSPITEQSAWAIIYQAMRVLGDLLCRAQPLYHVVSPAQICLTKEGDLHTKTFTQPGPDAWVVEKEDTVVAELGIVIYNALDYNLRAEEERSLSSGLSNLVDVMSGWEEEEDDTDEGIDEEEVEEGAVGPGVKLSQLSQTVLQLCKHHLAVEEEADQHYRAVCRALVTEMLDLSSFMRKVSSTNTDNKELQDVLRELALQDWADMWTSVMHQLRTGVKLKKVEYSRTPTEFEMTPYEMLMDDIRLRKFKLNPVEIPAETKKDARDLILDFIRSRPPLKKVELRSRCEARRVPATPRDQILHHIQSRPKLKPANQRQLKALRKESTPGELLMQDIRNSKGRQSLRRTNGPKPIRAQFQEASRTGPVTPNPAQKQIIPYEDDINKLLDFDMDDDISQDETLERSRSFSSSPSSSPPPSNEAADTIVLRRNLQGIKTATAHTSRHSGVVAATATKTSSAVEVTSPLTATTSTPGSSRWRKSVSVMETPAGVKPLRGLLSPPNSGGGGTRSGSSRRNSSGNSDVKIGNNYSSGDATTGGGKKRVSLSANNNTQAYNRQDAHNNSRQQPKSTAVPRGILTNSASRQAGSNSGPTRQAGSNSGPSRQGGSNGSGTQKHNFSPSAASSPSSTSSSSVRKTPNAVGWSNRGATLAVSNGGSVAAAPNRRKTVGGELTPIRSPLTTANCTAAAAHHSEMFNWDQSLDNSKYRDWIRNLHTLDLNLEEVSHIRSQMAKAELEDRNLSKQTLSDFERGRVCFLCTKVKFGIFYWAYPCSICTRYVCTKCMTKIRLPSERLREVPVACLSSQLVPQQETPDVRLRVPAVPTPTSSPQLLSRGGWNRLSLTARPSPTAAMLSQSVENLAIVVHNDSSRPRLIRSKTMGKAEVDAVKSMKLATGGTPHTVCLDCKDMLINITRAKRQAERREKTKSRLLSHLLE